MTRRIYIILLCALWLQAYGAESLLPKNYKFQNIDIRDGLSNNTVNSLYVDSQGYLWIATSLGLNRYDGYSIRTFYYYNNCRDTPIVNIKSVQEDTMENIWIENDEVIMRYNRYTNRFESDNRVYLNKLGFKIAQGERYRIKAVPDGGMWVLTGKTIAYKDITKNGSAKVWKVDIMPCEYLEGRNDDLYLSDGTEVWHFSKHSGKLAKIRLPKAFATDKGHLRIYIDQDGLLWVYSMVSEHICYFPSSDGGVQSMFPLPGNNTTAGVARSMSNAIRAIFDDAQGRLWIATDHFGIFIFDKYEGEFRNIRHSDGDMTSLISDNVTCITADRYGTIWIGHHNMGVSYYNEHNNIFTHKNMPGCDVSTMMFDRKGNLWLGTDGDGLFIERPDGSVEQTAMPKITISSLLEDKNGMVWAGTYNNGLYKMNDRNVVERYATENGAMPGNSVWQMAADTKGNIWYTSVFQKLTCFNPLSGKGRKHILENGDSVAGTSIISDAEGRIYCGTYYGLWRYSSATGKGEYLFGNKSGTQVFMQHYIGPMYMDNDEQTLWIGHMTGISVWNMRKDSIYYIDRSNGLLDTDIRGIAKDRAGNVWVSTARGLSCVRMVYDNANGMSFKIRKFTDRDGVQTEFFNTYAIACDSHGDVYVGGKNGYTRITPLRTHSADDNLCVSFSDIAIGDSILTLPEGQEWSRTRLKLSYVDNLISIRFFTGNLISANRILYAYRIVGLSEKWIYTSDNEVKLFSLAPGTYTLEVKASGDMGEWGEVSSLMIYVAPPFYLSWWMFLLYAVACLLTVFCLWRNTRRRHERTIAEQKASIEQQQQIQMSEMKLRFFTNISHDLRTPLTLITSPLELLMKEKMSEEIHDRLSLVYKNVNILLHQVNMLLDFRRLDVGGETFNPQVTEVVQMAREAVHLFADYAKDKKLTLSYLPQKDKIFAFIDAEKARKILCNLLSNAMKFTMEEGKVDVTVDEEGDNVIFIVADDGVGISNAEKHRVFKRFYQSHKAVVTSGSGIGLHIVSEYVNMHGGTVTVTDNMPKGTVFTVTIPKGDLTERRENEDEEYLNDTNDSITAQEEEGKMFTVLVVDDNSDLCHFLSDSLKDQFHVIIAKDGEEALQRLSRHSVSLVVSDIMMPKIDGLELCKRIKTTLKWSHIPVILLTARSADASIIEGLQHGADDYITKPFNIDHLKLRIQKFAEWAENNHRTFREKIEVEPSDITITPLDEEFVARAIRHVENRLSDPEYSVETLGRDMGMSRTNLYKKLLFITGKGPHEFIRTIRMKRAYRLLEKSQMQISEVAYAVGYSSPKRLSENFKAEYGMTPSEFVKSMKGKDHDGNVEKKEA